LEELVVVSKKYSRYQFIARDRHAPNNCKIVNIKDLDPKKALVICCGGNGTITPRKANFVASNVEGMLGIKVEDSNSDNYSYNHLNIISVAYGRTNEEDPYGRLDMDEYHEIATDLFTTRCLDENGNDLPFDQICKNFSLLTCFSHCEGGISIKNIFASLTRQLSQKGYTKEQIQTITAQPMQIAYAPYCYDTPVPTIRFNSLTDSLNKSLPEIFENVYGHKLDGIETQLDKEGYYMSSKNPFIKHNLLSVYCSRLLNVKENMDLSTLVDEHTICYLRRDEHWKSDAIATWKEGGREPWEKDPVAADVFSQTVSYALAVAVSNSIQNSWSEKLIPNPPMSEIKEGIDSIIQGVCQDDLKIPHPRGPEVYHTQPTNNAQPTPTE
jgi:hypothetical protein